MAIKNKFNNFLSQIYDKGLAKSDEGQVLVMSIIMFYECKNMKIIILHLIYFLNLRSHVGSKFTDHGSTIKILQVKIYYCCGYFLELRFGHT